MNYVVYMLLTNELNELTERVKECGMLEVNIVVYINWLVFHNIITLSDLLQYNYMLFTPTLNGILLMIFMLHRLLIMAVFTLPCILVSFIDV